MSNQLQVGFARVDITPPLGIAIGGYFKPRFAEGVLDPLNVSVVALKSGDTAVVMLSLDQCFVTKEIVLGMREAIVKATSLPAEAVFIHTTHSHTTPKFSADPAMALEYAYYQFVCGRMADATTLALEDLKPAKMGWGIGHAPNVAFVRRFRMKDGSVQTNPGVNNPDIVAPIGDVDERVNVIRFDRKDAETLVLVNFGNHPDTVGGNKISADWPGFLCRTVEQALDNTRCMFFNGAEGDINHVNVHPTKGDFNDLVMDFDDVARGYGHARYIGRVVAGAVLQIYDKVNYVDVDSIRYAVHVAKIPSNMPTVEQLPEAHRINDLHLAGRDDELPYKGMMLTTVVAEAKRMVLLENGPESFDMPLSGIAIGPVAFVGIPGEPFTSVGRSLKETTAWDLICPTALTNGWIGYFPAIDAYDEGGYEALSSRFAAGVAERIVEEGRLLLKKLE